MDDATIISLYQQRNQTAITETHKKYGAFCHRIALNILSLREDAEECVIDSYHITWNRIPPALPQSLKSFLGKIVRDLSISRYRKNRAQKRFSGMELLLSELEDCIPVADPLARKIEQDHLAQFISDWLDGLSAEERTLFIRRYWFGEELKTLAKATGQTPNRLAQRMLKLRRSLKAALEQEGVTL